LGYNSAFSRLGGLIAPMIVEELNDLLKRKIFCSLNFICIFVMFLLPETIGKKLEENIPEEEIE
jgi:hypothetical protein